MNTAARLADLAKKLAIKQNELDKIRHAFDKRLAILEQRKQGLQANLAQVETEILAAALSSSTLAAPAAAAPAAATTTSSEMPATLPLFLISVVKELGRPVTVAELTREVEVRKFPTKSKDLSKLIGNRVHDMIKKGYFHRAGGKKKGVIIGHGTPVRGRPGRKPGSGTNGAKGKSGPRKERFSLRSLLTDLLGESDHPMKAKELAQAALDAGYKTKSKNFIDNVWTALGSMDNIVNIAGQGYRLK